MPPGDERRQSLRIEYAVQLAPKLTISGYAYPVIDLSCGGCVLAAKGLPALRINQRVSGVLHFHEGSTTQVEGQVVRIDGNADFVVKFTNELPASYLRREIQTFGSVGKDRRRFFRMRYTLPHCPEFAFSGFRYQVLEISEAAIVVRCESLNDMMIGQHIIGTLHFLDGDSLQIDSTVLRLTRDRAVLLLHRYIPERRIAKEQQFFLQRARQR